MMQAAYNAFQVVWNRDITLDNHSDCFGDEEAHIYIEKEVV